ncbi:MAG: hypothetical protein HY319_29720 [Armatimonadetes bacterium]|nr:hypothetical protein [Armatimonadota bacterium]
MRDDYKDKIEQIRARRGNRDEYTPGNAAGANYNPTPSIGRTQVSGVGVGEANDTGAIDLGPNFHSPWLRDRVTLSLEGQIAMIEQRSTFRVNLADLGYTNRFSILPLRPGIFVKIEPPGTYRLVYHHR